VAPKYLHQITFYNLHTLKMFLIASTSLGNDLFDWDFT